MKQYCVFDSHCDTATELWRKRESLWDNNCMVSLTQAEELAGYGQFFAFCTTGYGQWSPEDLLFGPWKYLLDCIQNEPKVMLCRSAADYALAMKQNRTAAFLSLEGAEGIDCDPGRLEQLHEMGIRMTTLTWNFNNSLAGSAKENGPGLSAKGKEFVRRAQKLGILIDVSHISDRAFWDIMDVTEAPVIASHSNSRTRCSHFRNLTDEQYLAVCQTGGYVGINLYGRFLTEKDAVTFEDVYAHMDHFLQLGGNYVALGGDLDGCDVLPREFNGVKDYNLLAQFLECKGYTPYTVQNIFSDTMKRVVTQCIM